MAIGTAGPIPEGGYRSYDGTPAVAPKKPLEQHQWEDVTNAWLDALAQRDIRSMERLTDDQLDLALEALTALRRVVRNERKSRDSAA
jgi:hypothetical protein